MAEGRWLDPASAAAYIGVHPHKLGHLVEQGHIPAPSYQLGPRTPRYDRLALFQALKDAFAFKISAANTRKSRPG